MKTAPNRKTDDDFDPRLQLLPTERDLAKALVIVMVLVMAVRAAPSCSDIWNQLLRARQISQSVVAALEQSTAVAETHPATLAENPAEALESARPRAADLPPITFNIEVVAASPSTTSGDPAPSMSQSASRELLEHERGKSINNIERDQEESCFSRNPVDEQKDEETPDVDARTTASLHVQTANLNARRSKDAPERTSKVTPELSFDRPSRVYFDNAGRSYVTKAARDAAENRRLAEGFKRYPAMKREQRAVMRQRAFARLELLDGAQEMHRRQILSMNR